MKKIFLNLIKKLRKFLVWLWEQDGSSSQRSVGFGLGVFSGCFPFFGVQTLIGIFLAKIFKGNTIFAALGTWISNPITYVPLYWLNYRVGSVLLDKDKTIVDLSHMTIQKLWYQGGDLSSRLIIGSTFVGLLSGLVGGFGLYILLKQVSNKN
tara:strand:+ start:21 stop:476 length:456 start_codon:yes stop_codon:yes gene_type:complete